MRITWVARSFLDYRIPVYEALANMPNVELKLICSEETQITPARCIDKAKLILGKNIISLSGEKCFGKPWSPEQRSNSVFRIFWQPGLTSEIKKTKPDIVITEAYNHWTLPVFGLKLLGFKFKHVLCYERTKHTERNASYLKLKFISMVRKYIDAVHCNGILCKDFLSELGYPENKLKLGNMAADSNGLLRSISKITEQDRKAIRIKLGVKKVVYLFVGALIPRKGVKELLLAWGEAKLDNASLVLAGDGIQREELENMIIKQNIDNIVITGSVDYDNIATYYRAADCFIIPTLEDNWSLVVPEAMSCQLPIICSIYNGCHPELVTTENGWIFDPLNPDSIIKVLQKSFNEKDNFTEMGLASVKLQHSYSPNEIAAKIFSTCNELILK